MEILESIYNEVSAYREQFHEETSDIIEILLSKCTTRNNIGTITNGRFEDVCNELNTLTKCTEYLSQTIKAEYAEIHNRVYSYVVKYLILATNEETREENEAESNDVLFSMVNDMQAFDLNFLSFLGNTETFISEYSDSAPNTEALPTDSAQEPQQLTQWNGSKKEFAIFANEAFAKAEKKKKRTYKDKKDFVFIFFAKFSFPKFPTWTAQQCYDNIAQLSK